MAEKLNYRAAVSRITVIGLPEITEVWLDGTAIYSSESPRGFNGYKSVTFHSRLNDEELAEFRALMEKVNARISKSLNEERKIKGWDGGEPE